MVVSKTIDYIQIKIKMPYCSQEPTPSSKVLIKDLKDMYVHHILKRLNQDLEDMNVLCIFKIKIESLHLEYG